MLGDSAEAEDVAQETFMRLWHDGPRDRSPRTLAGWVYRTSTRLAIDRLRRQRRVAELHDEHATALEPSRAPAPDAQVGHRRALCALAADIPADELEVAVLSRLDAMDQAQIAKALGRSERTVRRLLSRFDARAIAFQEARGGRA